MNATEPEKYSPDWLTLREPADARARAADLAADLAAHLAAAAGADPADDRPAPTVVVHDLGCGTGSMGRWLAPRLPGPQHWVLHDRDPDLLALAAAGTARTGADGTAVTVETRVGDLTRLTVTDLAGASLVTASALLDLLTREEVSALAATCADVGCAALFTLSVAGHVELDPADPRDGDVAAAFDDHQRRTVADRRLLGPDAAQAAAEAFRRLGSEVQVRQSSWRLGADHAALTAEWLRGWVGAAHEQRPDLPLEEYLAGRLEAAAAGRLTVTVHHVDLLARPDRTV